MLYEIDECCLPAGMTTDGQQYQAVQQQLINEVHELKNCLGMPSWLHSDRAANVVWYMLSDYVYMSMSVQHPWQDADLSSTCY